MANKFRTSNNIFRTQVQNYIIDNLTTDTPDTHITIPEQLQQVVNAFNNYDSPYEQRRTPNKQQRFIEFLKGLPSDLSIEFYDYDISRRLESWFNLCGQEYKEKPNYTEHFYYFIADNFQRLCKKYHVDF